MTDMRISLKLDASTSGAEAIKTLVADLNKIDLAAKRAAQDIKNTGNTANGMQSRGLLAIATRFVEIHMAADLIRTAITAIPKALSAVVSEGIRVNAEFESIKYGIASVINAQLKLADSSGRQLEGVEKYNAALQLSEGWFVRIRVAALMTQATTEQLSRGFQTAVSVAAGQGITDLEKIFKLTVAITNAATAMNVNMAQVPVAIRAVLTGREATHNVVARTLGITLAQINAWKDEGTLVQNLEKRLVPFSEAAEKSAKSFKVMASNAQEAFQIISADVTSGAFTKIKESMNKHFWDLFDFKNMSLQSRFQPLVDAFKDAFTTIGSFISATIDQIMESLQNITDWVKQHIQDVDAMNAAWMSLWSSISLIVGELLKLSGTFTATSIETGGLTNVIKALSLGFALAADAIRIAGDIVKITFGSLTDAIDFCKTALNEGLIPVMLKFSDVSKTTVGKAFSDLFGRTEYAKALDNMDKVDDKFKETRKSIDAVREAKERLDEHIAGTGARNRGNSDALNFDARDYMNKKAQPATVTGPAWETPPRTAGAGAGIREASIESKNAIAVTKENFKLLDALVSEEYKNNKMSIEEYYTWRRKFINAQLEQDVATKQQELRNIQATEAKTPGERAKKANAELKIEGEIHILKMRSVALLNKADDERLAALDKYEDEVANLKNTLAKESGEELGSVTERVALKFKDTIAKMTAQGDKELLAKFLGVEEAKLALEDLSLTYQRVQTQMQNKIAIVTGQQDTGNLGPTEADKKRLNIYREWLPILEAIHEKQLAIVASNPNNPEFLAAAQSTQIEIESIKDKTIKLADEYSNLKEVGADAFANGLVTAMDSVADGTETVGQAFRSLAYTVVQALQQMLTKMLAVKALEGMMGWFGAGSSMGSALGSAATAIAGNAEGGLITGPGTGTSDSILRRLSNGEYVLRTAAVRILGVPFLDALNGLKSRPLYNFADGGLVQPVQSQFSRQEITHNINLGLDRAIIYEAMESDEGARISINHAKKNAKRFNSALGR